MNNDPTTIEVAMRSKGTQLDIYPHAVEGLCNSLPFGEDGDYHTTGIEYELKDLPSAEPEIIRCRECDYNRDGICRLLVERDPDAKDHRIYGEFFCAYGERRKP